MMGYTTTRITERVYAKHSPDHMCRAAADPVSAFGEAALRESCAQSREEDVEEMLSNVLEGLVEPRGIEPLTSTIPFLRSILTGFTTARNNAVFPVY